MKILIIKLGALGDIITSTSVIDQILKHHQQDAVSLLTNSNFKELFSNFENLNIVSFERKGILNAFKTIHWIRKHSFDRIYDLQSNDRTSIYCALSGSPFRAGNHPRFPYHVHPANKYIGECHSFERLNQIIKSADIKPAKPLPFLPIPNNIITEVSSWLDQHNLGEKPIVLLHAGSSPLHLKKRWPYFADLASNLSKSLDVVWIGGNDDIELNKTLSINSGINATNTFNIFGLVELGKRAKFAVTNDSAPMHILSCSQIPVFGLFGPTYVRRTHALGQIDNVITVNDMIAENDYSFEPQDISKISFDKVLNKLRDKKLL
ncbi:MAG TPA: lipopolysaccharide heptosyltransferase family protein [Thiotrichaceae bacterium]|jgi:ADP-heptose:LPS heptosyltransferase|nr:lipopolysaccharide heptosyltransferase family protein [Thiotrichaceae bacterium]